jgi:hypothetical protein
MFRYCHNDPIDHVDPMGLTDIQLPPGPTHTTQAIMMGIKGEKGSELTIDTAVFLG